MLYLTFGENTHFWLDDVSSEVMFLTRIGIDNVWSEEVSWNDGSISWPIKLLEEDLNVITVHCSMRDSRLSLLVTFQILLFYNAIVDYILSLFCKVEFIFSSLNIILPNKVGERWRNFRTEFRFLTYDFWREYNTQSLEMN